MRLFSPTISRQSSTVESRDQVDQDGFDLVWLLGVWQTGMAACNFSTTDPEWLAEYRRVLPDFKESDVCGSYFAVQNYRVDADFSGDDALRRLRERLSQRRMRLNHANPELQAV